jgi:hypothetical protein
VGYWVHVPAAGANIATVGTPADPTKNFPIALAQGWNQIGDPFLSGVPLSNCSVLSGSQTLTETAAAAGNVIYGNIYSYNGGTNKYTTAQALTTGLGYWIYAFSPCTLVVPHP